LGGVDLEAVVVVEVSQDAPTDLDLQHFDAFLLEGEETVQFYVVLVKLL